MTNDDMIIFRFEGIACPVRMENGIPLWELQEVLRQLDVYHSVIAAPYRRNPWPEDQIERQVVAWFEGRLDRDEVVKVEVPTDGRNPIKVCVNEQGIFHLLMFEPSQKAHNYRRWLCHEVLPSIRRTGSYTMKGSHPDSAEDPKDIMNRGPVRDLSDLEAEELFRRAADNIRKIRLHAEKLDKHDEKIERHSEMIARLDRKTSEAQETLAREKEARARTEAIIAQNRAELDDRYGVIIEGHVTITLRCNQLIRQGLWLTRRPDQEMRKTIGLDVKKDCDRAGVVLPEPIQQGSFQCNQYPMAYVDAVLRRRGYIY